MESIVIITNRNNKKKILYDLSKNKKLYNLKFYTFKELKKKVFFDYTPETLEYVMEKYKVNLNIAKIYIENMYFLKDINNKKVQFLNDIKRDLIQNNLLIYSEDFKKFLKTKRIIIYNEQLSKEEQIILDSLEINYEIRNPENKNYEPLIYEAKNMEQEVEFVVNKISELIHNNIDINKIKLIMNEEYRSCVRRYFDLFNIPINLDNEGSFFSTKIAQDFLNNYDYLDIPDNILELEKKYSNLNDLIRIINKTVRIKNKDIRKEFIISDFKEEKLNKKIYDRAVNLGKVEDYYLEDEYVFLLGFNIDSFPKIYKDDDYLSDDIKTLLNIDTSIAKNILAKKKVKDNLRKIKNLIITYKLNNQHGKCEPSLLIKDLSNKIEKIEIKDNVCYSKRNIELKYAMKLDNLYKYNIVAPDLALYKNNLNIKYLAYSNEFKGIKEAMLQDTFKEGLTLAYTNMEMYNECAFKYYVSKVLKLDIFQENFKTIIGNIVHHILELIYNKDVDIKAEIMRFIKDKDYKLGAKEYFYLEKLEEELEKIRDVLKKQEAKTKLNKYLFEEELYVYKDRNVNVTFKGLIDKVMLGEKNGKEVIVVVDYKTGNTLITLDNIKYGLNMQLPIYLYLLKETERFKEAIIGGFYIQKVLDNVPNISEKTLAQLREDNLKLQGYSNSDEDILELIDKDYLNSTVIKDLVYKQDGTLSKRAKVLTNEEMEDLKKVVEEKIEECIDNILKGVFTISPKVIKNKNIACEYCHFKDVCFKTKKDEVKLGDDNDGSNTGTEISD